MDRLKTKYLILGLIVVTIFITSCGASEEPPTPTAVPTFTAESATETELSSDDKVPTNESQVPRITVQELKERLDNGEAIVIADSRSVNAFEIRHIAGAISVPETEVEAHLDELALDQQIVFYCV